MPKQQKLKAKSESASDMQSAFLNRSDLQSSMTPNQNPSNIENLESAANKLIDEGWKIIVVGHLQILCPTTPAPSLNLSLFTNKSSPLDFFLTCVPIPIWENLSKIVNEKNIENVCINYFIKSIVNHFID